MGAGEDTSEKAREAAELLEPAPERSSPPTDDDLPLIDVTPESLSSISDSFLSPPILVSHFHKDMQRQAVSVVCFNRWCYGRFLESFSVLFQLEKREKVERNDGKRKLDFYQAREIHSGRIYRKVISYKDTIPSS